MNKEYFVNELDDKAWVNAIENIITEVENLTKVHLNIGNDIDEIVQFAMNTSMVFDENGEFII